MTQNCVLVYGGNGALGLTVVNHFRNKHFWVVNIDLIKNETADANVIVDPMGCWIEQEAHIIKEIEALLEGKKLDAILCVAGGWAGGNAAHKDFVKNADMMWKQSVWSGAIAARLASLHLKPGGLLQLTGAAPALNGTPSMIGYGMAKAAVHQLVASLASNADAGLPENTNTVGILPVTLDTPMNRKWMAKADFSTWTPLEFIAETLLKWTAEPSSRFDSGSLLKFVTSEGNTQIFPVDA